MALYERETRVRAPLDAVWEFHASVDGLLTLTPGWFGLEVESVTGPDGPAVDESGPDELVEGTSIELSARPFGVAPRQRAISVVERREDRRDHGAALFRDRMIEGPFEEWIHTHSFTADGEATVVRDRVEYRLPGRVGRMVTPLLLVGFAPAFWYRHCRTRELLED